MVFLGYFGGKNRLIYRKWSMGFFGNFVIYTSFPSSSMRDRMKKILGTLLLLVMISSLQAQNTGDTIVVSTFNYTQTYGVNQWSPGIRDTVIPFPDNPNLSYEKIIMLYNMRCKDGLVSPPIQGQTDIGCGEWDISCNTYITDSTQVDSTRQRTSNYSISGFTGNTYEYVTSPTHTFYQFLQSQVTINNTITETTSSLGAGTANVTDAMPTTYESGKSQYLLTATELLNAGVVAGDIDGMKLNVLNANNSEARFLRIRMKHTTASALDPNDPDVTGFTQVYFLDYTPVNGLEHFVFNAPFTWDGTSNVILEYSFTNSQLLNDITFEGEPAPVGTAVSSNLTDKHLYVPGQGQYGDAPDINVSHSGGLTIMAWIRYNSFNRWSRIVDMGNGPGADNILLANRGTNPHLHFSARNSNGNSNIQADNSLVIGEWQHVAATIDGSGNGRLYLNGQLVASGTMNIPDNVMRTNNYIGRSNWANDEYFDGDMDEVSYWTTALSQTEIQNWMYKDIDATHPNYSDLVYSYSFNDQNGNTVTDQSANGHDLTLVNNPALRLFRGRDMFKNLPETTERPNIDIVQGDYNLSTVTVTVLDSLQNVPNVVTEHQIIYNWGTAIDDVVDDVSTNLYWEADLERVLDENGNLVGGFLVSPDATINISDLTYYRRWPSKYEIMSFVTPYGINLDLGPEGKTYAFDMTDFAPILKGNRRMTIERGGQWMEDMDIKFLFIVGTPPRDVLDIKQVWRTAGGQSSYTNIINDNVFEPRDILMDANASYFKMRSSITGHGQEGEFIARQHYLNIDGGNNEFAWTVWKECAENPVYPQGGTWVFDRAGWCPGFPTTLEEFDLTPHVTPGQVSTIDYSMANATGSSNYIVNHQLVSYGEINHAVDATMDDIITPSNNVFYARMNPVCHEAVVRIKNTGSTDLTTVKITYGVVDGDPQSYEWSGNLAFGATEEVTLPLDPNDWISSTGKVGCFYAEVSEPNGGSDEYSYNNRQTSFFDATPTYENNVVFWFMTNNAANESNYALRDAYSGQILFTRNGMTNFTQYRDTFDLQTGCYILEVYDTDDDGIDFFANNDGVGSLSLRTNTGTTLQSFDPDYGDGIRHYFTIGYPLDVPEEEAGLRFDVFPNPSSGQINLEIEGFETGDLQLEVYSIEGVLVHREAIRYHGGFLGQSVNLNALAGGTYLLKLNDGEKSQHKRVVLY